MRDYTPKAKKVIMVGKGHGWDKAPAHAPQGYEVWGINDLIMQRTEIDLLFNIHCVKEYSMPDMAGVQLAENLDIPIIMPQEYKDIKNSIEFPLKKAIKEFGTDYFMTGIAYMLAYAIMKGYEQIDCYGINMRGDDEKYKNARACVEYWIGRCQQAGIKVNMYGKYCDCLKIFDRRIYGYNLGDNPKFQHIPDDINDRALYLSFVVGLDREMLEKANSLLSIQKNSKYFNNIRAIPLNDPGMNTMLGNIFLMLNKHGDGVKFVGDVGFYNLMHVDQIINTEHSCKYVYLKSDKKKCHEDWMKFSKDANFWTNPECEHWNGDKRTDYEMFFPKYDLPKEEAFDKFYDSYDMIARRTKFKYPTQMEIFDYKIFDTKEGQEKFLSYLGYKKEEMTIKEDLCQSSTEKLTTIKKEK